MQRLDQKSQGTDGTQFGEVCGKNNKNGFYRFIGQKRQAKEIITSLIN